MSLIYLLGALLLIIGMVLITLFIRPLRHYAGYTSLLAPVIASVYFLSQIPNVLHQKVISFKLAWMPAVDLNLDLGLDGLGLVFALIISIIGITVFFYATQYLTPNGDNLPRFFVYLLLFMFSMLGIVISNSTILMYVFWELTSISSFLLISYWYGNADSQLGAIQSFMITVLGGLTLLTDFIMLYITTGTNIITGILSQDHHISEHPLFIPMIIMMLIGALTKSAQFPFHIWLPKAMAAPTPVGAYLHSATMVKAGISLLFRFTPVLGPSNSYIYIVTFVGLITMMFGPLTALRQYDLKGILAYSTVSQLGMIMTIVDLGGGIAQHPSGPMAKVYTLILFTGLFHVTNHALFKCTLSMGVGIIDHEAGTRDTRKLNGMRKFLPKIHLSMTLAALSMAGVPLLNGFSGKEMFFDSSVRSIELEQFSLTLTIIIVALGVIASIFTLVHAVYMLKEAYWGELNEKEVPKKHIHEPWLFSLPTMISAVMLSVIFLIPNTFTRPIVLPALRNVTNLGIQVDKMAPHVSQWHGINLPPIFSIIVIILGIILAARVNWEVLMHYLIRTASITNSYRKAYSVFEHYAGCSIRGVMTSRLNYYNVITFLAFSLFVAYGFLRVGFPKLHPVYATDLGSLEVPLVISISVVGIALVLIRQRLTTVILNGIIGYSVALFYLIMGAPDLALTQLVAETITTILFVVSSSRLPNISRKKVDKKKEMMKIVVAFIFVGAVVTLVFMAQQGDGLETISKYYMNAKELTGGKNIVNAISGDLRALDTMFEGLVLIIAGPGIYTLLDYKDRRSQDERKQRSLKNSN